MGNASASAREEAARSNGDRDNSMSNSPPGSPGLSRSPLLFAPQCNCTHGATAFVGTVAPALGSIPLGFTGVLYVRILWFRVSFVLVTKALSRHEWFMGYERLIDGNILVPVAPLKGADGSPVFNQMWQSESNAVADSPPELGIPTVLMWNYGGNDVAVEGSWDNWTSRKKLQRSGKDHSILLVLPSGIYHYKFIVDGEWRYMPDLPFVTDEVGGVCNLLDVHNYVPENLDSVAEFEAPPSPDSSYSQTIPSEEDFAKEPLAVPPHLQLTVLGMEKSDEASSSQPQPQHVVLNHLFIEKGWASQSMVALGLTHRFQSKYVTVVLYKPLKR